MMSTPVVSIARQKDESVLPLVSGYLQVIQDTGHRVAAVQHVKMDAGHSVIPEFAHLGSGVLYSHVAGAVIAICVLVQ